MNFFSALSIVTSKRRERRAPVRPACPNSIRCAILLVAWLWIVLFAEDHSFAQPRPDSPVRTNFVSITVRGDYRIISANGLPGHPAGPFADSSGIAPQQYNFRIPLHPVVAERPVSFKQGFFGIATNGVPFDPGAAQWWNNNPRSGWNYEPMGSRGRMGLDDNNASIQPRGAYEYHGLPTALMPAKDAAPRMSLLGWAADGFPIYAPIAHSDPASAASPLKPVKSSYAIKKGPRPGGPGGSYDGTFTADFEYVPNSGDLDECNGRFGVTPEFPAGTYHYFITKEFPFIPRKFCGIPSPGFIQQGRPPFLGAERPPGGPQPGFNDGPPLLKNLPPKTKTL